jgi:hypothetical protein
MSDVQNIATTGTNTDPPAYRISPVGIEFLGELDQREWTDLGKQLGSAARSIGFLIGDWLNYGEAKVKYGEYSHEEGGIYHDAIKITGLDYKTLANYANVSRKVQFSLRKENLSFDHHRRVAPLKTDEEKQKWLQIAEKVRDKQGGKTMSSRRLAKSILLGRVATIEEMSLPDDDRGCDNVHPHVNRIVAFWGKMKRSGFVDNADMEDIQIMLDDLGPVLDIAHELQQALVQHRGGGVAGSHVE